MTSDPHHDADPPRVPDVTLLQRVRRRLARIGERAARFGRRGLSAAVRMNPFVPLRAAVVATPRLCIAALRRIVLGVKTALLYALFTLLAVEKLRHLVPRRTTWKRPRPTSGPYHAH